MKKNNVENSKTDDGLMERGEHNRGNIIFSNGTVFGETDGVPYDLIMDSSCCFHMTSL